MQITYNDVMAFLTILALAMTIVLLYHVIIIALNMRRITKRADTVSKELEAVVMRPLSLADNAMEWAVGFLEGLKDKHSGKKHHHKKKESDDFDVVDL